MSSLVVVVPKAYWEEAANDLPQNQSVNINVKVLILRWPGKARSNTGLDLAEPDGRYSVLEAF
ncbi:1524_t:CDS:1, partial [Paraglomus brasilianum]